MASIAPEVVSCPILLRNLVLASSPTKLEAMDKELEKIKKQKQKKQDVKVGFMKQQGLALVY